MKNNQKLAELHKYLLENSDEKHAKSITDIKNFFNEQGTTLDNKTLITSLKFLKENQGVDVIKNRSAEVSYYIGKRDFETPEIKALLDAVSACGFLSKSKKTSLQNKLLKSFSIYDRENYLNGLYLANGKANESMYKSIDFINKAINKKVTIEFKYMRYIVGKGRVPRHNGKIYAVSPYALILNNQRYYLVGYSFKDDEIRSYRVDRIDKAIESEEYKYKPLIGKIDKYVNENFGMYHGEKYNVVLKCKNEMLDQVIDKFGNKIETSKIDNEYFTALITAQDSPTFYSWVFSFGGDIKIVAPENIVNNFNELLNKFK